MSNRFPSLMSPLKIGPSILKNRIVSTGHDTGLTDSGLIGDRFIAYHQARAKAGVGLIVTQVASVHESGLYTAHMMQAHHDECIPGFRRFADAMHAEGTVVFAQLIHPGREIHGSDDGVAKVAWSSSATPNERFHVMPRPMSREMIASSIEGYAAAARRIIDAGVDGVEVLACYGYLPAQFLSAFVNSRTDEYGGEWDNRMRFMHELFQAVRTAVGPDGVVGIRISADDLDGIGVDQDESTLCCKELADEGLIDYVSLVVGSSASTGGAYHVAAPMTEAAAYTADYTTRMRSQISIPLMVTGRINQPQDAEKIIADGKADACGMTRALICDPLLAEKVALDRPDEIRACIGCNQACIGHFFKGVAISCIQNPASGREISHPRPPKVGSPKRVMIIGGGPAGMKAAITAAEQGHDVSLFEGQPRLGGQVTLAQLLPGRAEFGGLVTNLETELKAIGVDVNLNTRVQRSTVEELAPDVVIVATGAKPYIPALDGLDQQNVVTAWDVISGHKNVGNRVVVADWRCDWIGVGVAEMLALEGCHVRLAVNGTQVAEELMPYMRDYAAGRMFDLGVSVLPYARLHGASDDTVYFEHTVARQPMICEDVDTLVLALGHQPEESLVEQLDGIDIDVRMIGDCLAARTAEEAVFEGWETARTL